MVGWFVSEKVTEHCLPLEEPFTETIPGGVLLFAMDICAAKSFQAQGRGYLCIDAAFIQLLQGAVLFTHRTHDGFIGLTDLFAATRRQESKLSI